jgi:hypothetical protein
MATSASNQYYVSETDIAQMFKLSGLPAAFASQFVRDYSAIKRDIGKDSDRITEAENEIVILTDRADNNDIIVADLGIRLTDAETELLDLGLRVDQAETDITDNKAEFDAHVIDRDTHGVLGNIVGTQDYPTAITGGAVLLAAAVTDAVASAANAALNPNAAGVAYLQADAATWVAMLNEHKAQINLLKTDLNAAITQLNALLAAERTAKQLAP